MKRQDSGNTRVKVDQQISTLPKVFIAWGGNRGEAIGIRLHDALRKRNVNAFISSRDMVWGDRDWEARLRREIKTSDAFILVCTREACCSEQVMKEIGWAKDVRVIMPLKVDEEPVHPMVLRPHRFDFDSHNPDYDRCKEELMKGIDRFGRKIIETNRPGSVGEADETEGMP